jgi:uncharacterized alpha-E superfamily protein
LTLRSNQGGPLLSSLLSRFAENMFWLARYMERAENLARILDVNNPFASNERGEPEWQPIVTLFADERRFFEAHDEASARNVLKFYLTDRDNLSSMVSTVGAARENARTLRHLISTETWTQLNMFHNRLKDLRDRDLTLSRLSGLCLQIKESCQLHTGIIEGTGYRDSGWYIYQIGKYLERMDQTTRLLDINYHRLLPSLEDVGTEIDASRWNALLRSAAGYHAFRRVHPKGMSPTVVADFLLFDRGFQRSVAVCVGLVDEMMRRLGTTADLSLADETLQVLKRIAGASGIDSVIAGGLHEFLDHIQQQVMAMTDGLGAALFGHSFDPTAGAITADEYEAQSQSQAQAR